MPELSFSNLPQVLKTIRNITSNGALIINNGDQQAALYYKKGQLVHAWAGNDRNAENGESVLYRLLNWKQGRLEWKPDEAGASLTIDSLQQEDFYQAVEDLAGLGHFKATEKPEKEIQEFFKVAASQKKIQEPFLPLLSGRVYPLAVQPATFQRLIEVLKQEKFSGYISLRFNSVDTGQGVVTLEKGQPDGAYLKRAGQEWRGAAAWEQLNLPGTLPEYEVVTVPEKVLCAYRALLDTHQPYQDLPATLPNFKGLSSTFKKSGRSGVVRFRLDSVQLMEFFVEGAELGTFSVAPSGEHLRPASGGLSLMLGHPRARMDVFVSRNINLDKPPVLLSPGESKVVAETMAATLELTIKLSSVEAARLRLQEIITQLVSQYPFMAELDTLDLHLPTTQQVVVLGRWLEQLKAGSRQSVIKALEKFFDLYLQPTCLKIGSGMFHEMVIRALGPANAQLLQQMDLRVDFFDPAQEVAAPHAVGLPGYAGVVPPQEIENPYDF